MEPLSTESILQAYEALILGFIWLCAAAACLMALVYLCFLRLECFSPRRGPRRAVSAADRPLPSISQIADLLPPPRTAGDVAENHVQAKVA